MSELWDRVLEADEALLNAGYFEESQCEFFNTNGEGERCKNAPSLMLVTDSGVDIEACPLHGHIAHDRLGWEFR